MHLYQTNALQATLSIVDHTTGSIVWSQPYMSSSEQRSGAIDADAVYINGIISLALQDASFRWFSELPLMQQVRTSTAWCGVISIRTDKFGCVDAQSGKPASTDLIPLPTDARIITNEKYPYIGVVAPLRLQMYASPDGELLWDHIPQTPIQDAIFTENNQLIVAYIDGRVSIHDAATGLVIALLRDAPIDFLTNSHYGRITPLLWHQNMVYLMSNSHILAFDTAAYTGAIP
jgi:hypothetical protein